MLYEVITGIVDTGNPAGADGDEGGFGLDVGRSAAHHQGQAES